jgi:hypothetical protein
MGHHPSQFAKESSTANYRHLAQDALKAPPFHTLHLLPAPSTFGTSGKAAQQLLEKRRRGRRLELI